MIRRMINFYEHWAICLISLALVPGIDFQILQDCPVSNEQCVCQRKYGAFNYIYCDNVGHLSQIPLFNHSNSTITSFEEVAFRYNSSVDFLQNYAFSGIHTTSLRLGSLGIKMIAISAFRGLEDHLVELYLDDNQLVYLPSTVLVILKQLEYVNLQNNKLIRQVSYPPKLRYLSVFNNRLSILKASSFQGLNDLSGIYIGNNGIKILPGGIFGGLYHLLELDLNSNLLTELTVGIFASLVWTERLDLSNNNLTILHEGTFTTMAAIRYLDLSRNNLTTFQNNLFHPNCKLRHLDLSNNNLRAIENLAFVSLENLHGLYLQHNSLNTLGENLLHRFRRLSILDISHNRLTDMPVSNVSLHNLFVMRVSNNNIGTIASLALSNFPGVSNLDLSNNRIKTIVPGSLNKAPFLNSIRLNYNRLERITDDLFGNMTYMEFLHVENNGLVEISSKSLNGMEKLWHVGLQYNKISIINNNFFENCKSLVSLHLNHNQFRTINGGMFKGLSKLRTLNLESNMIRTIPRRTFTFAPNVQTLTLKGNLIARINVEAFRNLRTMDTLDISYNKLESFNTKILLDSYVLRSLWMSNNHLSDGEKTRLDLSDIPHLITLDLSKNNFTRMEIKSLGKKNNLRELRINGNPFDCSSCSVSWISALLPGKIPKIGEILCWSPPTHEGTPMLCFIDQSCRVSVTFPNKDPRRCEKREIIRTTKGLDDQRQTMETTTFRYSDNNKEVSTGMSTGISENHTIITTTMASTTHGLGIGQKSKNGTTPEQIEGALTTEIVRGEIPHKTTTPGTPAQQSNFDQTSLGMPTETSAMGRSDKVTGGRPYASQTSNTPMGISFQTSASLDMVPRNTKVLEIFSEPTTDATEKSVLATRQPKYTSFMKRKPSTILPTFQYSAGYFESITAITTDSGEDSDTEDATSVPESFPAYNDGKVGEKGMPIESSPSTQFNTLSGINPSSTMQVTNFTEGTSVTTDSGLKEEITSVINQFHTATIDNVNGSTSSYRTTMEQLTKSIDGPDTTALKATASDPTTSEEIAFQKPSNTSISFQTSAPVDVRSRNTKVIKIFSEPNTAAAEKSVLVTKQPEQTSLKSTKLSNILTTSQNSASDFDSITRITTDMGEISATEEITLTSESARSDNDETLGEKVMPLNSSPSTQLTGHISTRLLTYFTEAISVTTDSGLNANQFDTTNTQNVHTPTSGYTTTKEQYTEPMDDPDSTTLSTKFSEPTTSRELSFQKPDSPQFEAPSFQLVPAMEGFETQRPSPDNAMDSSTAPSVTEITERLDQGFGTPPSFAKFFRQIHRSSSDHSGVRSTTAAFTTKTRARDDSNIGEEGALQVSVDQRPHQAFFRLLMRSDRTTTTQKPSTPLSTKVGELPANTPSTRSGFRLVFRTLTPHPDHDNK